MKTVARQNNNCSKWTAVFWTAVILSPFQNASGQFDPHIHFSHYTTEQGLAHNSGNCFAQDEQGFLWIGCNGALERFNGYEFEVYKPVSGDSSSLSGTIVWSLYIDRNQELWIGTIGGGLNRYLREQDAFISYRNDPADSASISSDNVSSIIGDLSGRLWVATRGGGLNRFDENNRQFYHFRHRPGDPNSLKSDVIHKICIDPTGLLWIGTEAGLNIIDPESNLCRSFYNYPGDLDFLDDVGVISLLHSKNGSLWIGTWRHGLYQFDLSLKSMTRFTGNPDNSGSISGQELYDIFEDSFGQIWIASESGLHLYISDTGGFINYTSRPGDPASLSDNFVRSIYEDKTGVLWIGTNNGGINKIDLHRKKFIRFSNEKNNSNSLSNNHVYSIHEDNSGVLWIATRGGLNRYDRQTQRFRVFTHNPGNPYSIPSNSVLFVTSRGRDLWIGTDHGMSRFNPDSDTFKNYQFEKDGLNCLGNDNVRVIHIDDRTGLFWIGSWGGGLDRFDPNTGRFTNFPVDTVDISSNVVLTILQDRHGTLWLGTFGKGLIRFQPETGTLKYYMANPDNPEALQDNVVHTLHQDNQEQIWIGTGGGGLARFNPVTGNFQNYDVENGLPSQEITAILSDSHHNLWISSGKGLSFFDQKDNSFINFDIHDGLQGWVFYKNSACQGKDGALYFGGSNGFNQFFPKEIKTNPFIPQVIISDLTIMNQPVRIGDRVNGRIILNKPIFETREIVLTHKEYIFSIEFTALHYTAPMKNKYQYMLVGINNNWIKTGADRRVASYTTLRPGHYTFKVKASNNDGNWNPVPLELGITILPPFWQTWWFRSGLALLVLLTVVCIHYYRVRSLENHRKNLEQEVAERTAELKRYNEELEAFTYSVSHDLRSPLRSMDGFSQILCEEYGKLLDKQGMSYLERIQKSSHYMSHLIDNLLKLSRLTRNDLYIEYFDLGALAESVSEEVSLSYPNQSVQFIAVKNVFIYGDRTLFRVLLRNLIDNAWKFTSRIKDPKIELGTTRRQNNRIIYLKDNGVGFDNAYSKKLFDVFQRQHADYEGTGVGLATVKRIIRRHGGEIWAEGEVGHGAVFYFIIPTKGVRE